MLKNEEDIHNLIQSDRQMMSIIRAAGTLGLPDWWICAGFVRSKIWDTLHGFDERTSIPDVDVIYFDPADLREETEKGYEQRLFQMMPEVPWSVKNEARMHLVNGLAPYTSSEDAISKFPETATALGVTLDQQHKLVLTAPSGLEDVLNLQVKPTASFTETKERAAIYEERLVKKNWQSIWPKVSVTSIKPVT
ncbi:nucleotidyltransferase family protein [Jeotgalibacillus aurantiacus]|uniref:nucleotidyltransferase family protein n=1 Tax=Jeotgalibacillus aurantiacus TaxID=2763266 RepID=UPI001D0BDD74|nr:nucleotidyltransferase family protein [Jeotgalibacillus aurantiacus]